MNKYEPIWRQLCQWCRLVHNRRRFKVSVFYLFTEFTEFIIIIIIVSLFTHCNTAKSIKMVQIVINNIQVIQ